jgi:hypothetical protein
MKPEWRRSTKSLGPWFVSSLLNVPRLAENIYKSRLDRVAEVTSQQSRLEMAIFWGIIESRRRYLALGAAQEEKHLDRQHSCRKWSVRLWFFPV